MSELIKALRAEGNFELTTSYYPKLSKEDEKRSELLEDLQYGGGKKVHTEFEDGGRWSNYKTTVYELTADDGEKAYFQVWKEVPATEMQEGCDFTTSVSEVVPYDVTVTKYRKK